MPEPADEIRAQAVEVIGRLMFGADFPDDSEEWEDWATRYRRHAAPYVDVLAAVGLLPTDIEWGVIGYHDGEEFKDSIDVYTREDAERKRDRHYPRGAAVRQRYVTDWREADR
ncbi:hypothetical protein [Nocardia puris]|uniref:hypothetical protein n=1 Tax=Nocardia puris TaxID=208602 RepID=UPI002E1F9115